MIRGKVKWCGLRMAAVGGLFALARRATRRRFRLFAYHGVARDVVSDLNFDGFFAYPNTFEQHLRTLKGHYHVMSLGEIVRRLHAGEPIPEGAAAITFDDGYLNNFTEAAPLLDKYQLPATFFVTTGFIDRTHTPWWFALRQEVFSVQGSGFRLPDGSERLLETFQDCITVALAWEAHLKNLPGEERDAQLLELNAEPRSLNPKPWAPMTWDQIRQLAERGHGIGAHTVSHISLGHEPVGVVDREIAESLARIRAEVGDVCRVYSYPYGAAEHFTPQLAGVLKREGCIGGVTTIEGMNRPDAEPFLLKRLNVTGHHDRNAFRALASGLTHALKSRRVA